MRDCGTATFIWKLILSQAVSFVGMTPTALPECSATVGDFGFQQSPEPTQDTTKWEVDMLMLSKFLFLNDAFPTHPHFTEHRALPDS